jgi:hypothetical protein
MLSTLLKYQIPILPSLFISRLHECMENKFTLKFFVPSIRSVLHSISLH